MALQVIAGGMAATSCRIASFNCSIVPGQRALCPGTLFRLIFIDLQNVGVISAAPCMIAACRNNPLPQGGRVFHTPKVNKEWRWFALSPRPGPPLYW